MKIRIVSLFVVSALFSASAVIMPVWARAAGAKDLTSEIISGKVCGTSDEPQKKQIEITKDDRSSSELQIRLKDELKVYINGGESPYDKDLAGKPLRSNYRALFGFRIPL